MGGDETIRPFNRCDAGAFEAVYRSHYRFVYNICLRMLRDSDEAEDATQDVFVCVWRKINTFRGASAFSSWLFRLTTNSVLMRFRKKRNILVPLEDSKENEEFSYPELGAPDLNLNGSLDRLDIQAALEMLPHGYKTVFVLHDIHGYFHREIAELHGHSVGNSKSQLHRARVQLQKLLGGVPQKSSSRNRMRQKAPPMSNRSFERNVVLPAKTGHLS
ncbi:MAG: RNA polymerase sigma factor [Candidatus Acidiferrum sp.]